MYLIIILTGKSPLLTNDTPYTKWNFTTNITLCYWLYIFI